MEVKRVAKLNFEQMGHWNDCFFGHNLAGGWGCWDVPKGDKKICH